MKNLDRQRAFIFEEEFGPIGLLHAFHHKVSGGYAIDLVTLQRETILQNNVGLICAKLAGQAAEATIEKLDGVYVHLKMEKAKLSFGAMYSLLETLRKRYFIKEYSCNHSTLEQVFNTFAVENRYAKINRRLS